MEHPGRQLSGITYHQCRINTTGIGWDNNCDMEFSRKWRTCKCMVQYYSRPGCVVVTPNKFMFPRLYYQGKWMRVLRMYDSYERCKQRLRKDSHWQDWWWEISDEELWESGHVLYATQRTRSILNSKYQKYDLCQIRSDRKKLISDKQIILYHVLTKY